MKKLLRKVRKIGYPVLKYTGDAEAAMRGTIFRRVRRRIMGKFTGKAMGAVIPPKKKKKRKRQF